MCERVIVDRQRRTGKVSGSLHGRILQIALLHIFVRILVLPLHAHRTRFATLIDAQERMPAQALNVLIEPARI